MHSKETEVEKITDLWVIHGLMGMGKTENLIKEGKKAKEKGKNVLAVFHFFELKRQKDKKEKGLYSRNGDFFKADAVKSGSEILEKYKAQKENDKKPDTVLIDEGQFFVDDKTLLSSIIKMTSEGTTVKIAGLLHDFLKNGFGPMPELVKKAEHAFDLPKGNCKMCKKNQAQWMQRLIIEKDKSGNVTKKPAHRCDPIVLVGKENLYERRCNNCHKIPKCKENCPNCKKIIEQNRKKIEA